MRPSRLSHLVVIDAQGGGDGCCGVPNLRAPAGEQGESEKLDAER